MKTLSSIYHNYSKILIRILIIIISGSIGGFLFASAVLLLIITFSRKIDNLELLFILFFLTFILADNFKGPLAFFQNYRFVIILICFIYLLSYKNLKFNYANYFLPFCLVSFVITIFYSPLGIPALLRVIGFWIIPYLVFKFTFILHRLNTKRVLESVLLMFVIYTVINFLLLPFSEFYLEGRFRGLMANPNGLGLVMMFFYALVELIQKKNQVQYKASFFFFLKILFFVLIILTGSRTAFFSIIGYLIFKRFIGYKLYLFFVLYISAVLYILINTANVDQILSATGLDIQFRFDSFENASGRVIVWGVAIQEILDNFYIGNGFMYDNYFIQSYKEKYIGEYAARHWNSIWNSYLSLMLNTGIIGLLSYLYIWIRIFNKAIYKTLGLAFVILCFLSGITESWMAASLNAFTPMMLLYWSFQSLEKSNNISK